jgi:hypothetical protein
MGRLRRRAVSPNDLAEGLTETWLRLLGVMAHGDRGGDPRGVCVVPPEVDRLCARPSLAVE